MAKFNPPQYDPRMLHYIFSFFLFGQIALAIIIIYLINDKGAMVMFDIRDIPTFSLPIMVLSTNFIARKLFLQQFNRIASVEELERKMQIIQMAHIIEWIMVEGGTLLLLVFAQIENNHYFSVLALINIAYFFTLRPKILTFNEEF
ncbi:MAG: hypothetical protein N4A46_13710 [Schleiferiaceae bacterium]|jgi:hypothetical protein|nr:hypothetical protein [Schleiferiaceae bacterium]